jgi:TRAP-type uncharacterized transport system fused permease subunit
MTVVMVAPALVKVGMPVHVAHLLSFYFAVLSEVSPPVGLSPSAAAAVTGGNPFGSMMQAWKYSLPAFLVPFLFSANQQGANLLLVGASPVGFVLACVSSLAALAYLSIAIVGHFGIAMSKMERAILAFIACVMVVFPLGASWFGFVPFLVGGSMVYRLVAAAKKAAPPAAGAPAV